MDILCEKCGFANKIKFNPDLEGKKVQFRCKNKSCDFMINTKLSSTIIDKATKITNQYTSLIIGAYIIVEKAIGEKIKYDLNKGINLIGRKSKAYSPDIAIETKDRTLSRRHCTILQKENQKGHCEFVLKDYQSANSTKLNQTFLGLDEALYLVDGDTITMGQTSIIFKQILAK